MMTDKRIWESWKQKKSAVEPIPDFTERVMAEVRTEQERPGYRHDALPGWAQLLSLKPARVAAGAFASLVFLVRFGQVVSVFLAR